MRSVCPVCAKEVVKASGYSKASILIIGEFPGVDELETGRPFVGGAGRVLRHELSLAGLDLLRCRITNLWLHEKTDNENCFQVGLEQCLEEAKGKQAILLLGSDTVLYFTGYNVSDVTGLQVESNQLSAPIIFASVNPAIVYHGTVGEVRFAMENFVEKLKEENVI